MTLVLPPQLDTLAALRLGAALRGAAAGDGPLVLDASGVAHIGLAALQLLAVARAACGGLRLAPSSGVVEAAARVAGLGPLLLGDPAPPPAPAAARATLRFADRTLDYGGEPLDRLRDLQAAGVHIHAAGTPPPLAAADADRLWLRFELAWPAEDMRRDGQAAPAGPAPWMTQPGIDEGDVIVVPATDAPRAAPPAPSPAAPSPATATTTTATTPADRVALPGGKIDQLVALVGELVIAQASLSDRLGAARVRTAAAELAEVDRLVRALQDSMIALSAAPLGEMLGRLGAGPDFPGAAMEVERALIGRLLPALEAATGAAGLRTLAAAEDGSFVAITLDLGAHPPLDALRRAVRGVGGRLESSVPVDEAAGTGGTEAAARGAARLVLRLPRSLLLLDAIIVEVGQASYAIPVAYMVEGLRPAPGDLHRTGPDTLLLRYRDAYIPVIGLGARLGAHGWQPDPTQAVLVLVEADARIVALLVDHISDQRQIVVKPLEDNIGPVPGVLGASVVRGDRIALVLDVFQLA